MEEYERTINQLIGEREREKLCIEIERDKIKEEKEQARDDLEAVERAFNDLHRWTNCDFWQPEFMLQLGCSSPNNLYFNSVPLFHSHNSLHIVYLIVNLWTLTIASFRN